MPRGNIFLYHIVTCSIILFITLHHAIGLCFATCPHCILDSFVCAPLRHFILCIADTFVYYVFFLRSINFVHLIACRHIMSCIESYCVHVCNTFYDNMLTTP